MEKISAEQLREMRDADPDLVVINTLDSEHFQDKHIPHSINIPVSAEDFAERVEQALGGKHNEVVVYCASIQCDSSEKASKELAAAGFTHVYDMESGMQGWEEAHLPVEAGA